MYQDQGDFHIFFNSSLLKTQDSYLTALLSYCTKTCTFLLMFWGGELETNTITQYYIAAELPTTTSTHKFVCQCSVQAKFAF